MKRIFLLSIPLLFATLLTNAQQNLEVVLKTQYNFNLLTSAIDSITFDVSADTQMVLFQGGIVEGYGIKISRIDTLKFNSDTLELDEPMDGEFESQIAALPDTIIPTQDLFFEDGQSIYEFLQETDPAWLDNPPYLRNWIITDASSLSGKDQKKLFLARMFDMANHLVTRANHASETQPNGLAYVFGGKQIEFPINPSPPTEPSSGTSCPPDPGCSDQLLKGLDCSGMLGLMAQRSGVPIMNGPSGAQANAQNWNNRFNSANSHKFNKLKYTQLTAAQVPTNQLKQGDIVSLSGHVGIILSPENLNSVLMYQSNGQPRLCPTTTSQPCTNNTSNSRGPRTIIIGTPLFNQLFGANYSVLRLDTISGCSGGITSVTDIDGNVYPVVQIGSQCWMKENLRTTKSNNGLLIPNVTSAIEWNGLTNSAWCNLENNPSFDMIFGKLYNWYSIEDDNLCPIGWHIPSDQDWNILIGYLDPNHNPMANGAQSWSAGGAMKANFGWIPESIVATNSSGFTGLGGAYRGVTGGDFGTLGYYGYWWSSAGNSINSTRFRSLSYADNTLGRYLVDIFFNPNPGFSIRCVKN